MFVKIIQFKRPNGQPFQTGCQVDIRLREKYEQLLACNCRLTAEILPGGSVSQTIEHEEGDFKIVISPNNVQVKKDLEAMIASFDVVEFNQWLKALNEPTKPPTANKKSTLKERK